MSKEVENTVRRRKLENLLVAPVIMGGVCSFAAGVPLDALLQVINREVGMVAFGPIIGGSAAFGAVYALLQELNVKG